MSISSLIDDIPTCLLLEIWSKWLGGIGAANCRSILRLDSAVCNKQARTILFDLYSQVKSERFVLQHDLRQMLQVEKKMQWLVGKIKISSLELTHFKIDHTTMKSFCRWNAQSLKELYLSNAFGVFAPLTKAIATECKALMTLSLERCNLTMPIATILNRTSTITELRLQGRDRPRKYERTVLAVSLLERICCRTVTKLALLDYLPHGCAAVILVAFPNAVELELFHPEPFVLHALLSGGRCHSLHLMGSTGDGENELVSAVGVEPREHLRSFTLSVARCTIAQWPVTATSLVRLLGACSHLTSLTLWRDRSRFSDDFLVHIAEHCHTRLQELRISECALYPASFATLAEKCTNLRVLNLGFYYLQYLPATLRAEHWNALFTHCSHLERLRVRDLTVQAAQVLIDCIGARDSALQVLSVGGLLASNLQARLSLQGLRRCRALRRVEVEHSNYLEAIRLEGVKVEVVAYHIRDECNF